LRILRADESRVAPRYLARGGNGFDAPGMPLTRAQKNLVGVLGLAVGALVLDAAFLRPASVSATPELGASEYSAPAGDAGAAEASAGGAASQGAAANRTASFDPLEARRTTLAARLDELASNRPARGAAPLDALFATPADWQPAKEDAPAETPDAVFVAPNLRLTSVLLGTRPVAIINGKTVGLGERVEGSVVARIAENAVEVVDPDGTRRVLHLPRAR
jgi:hypothetical protein